MESGGASCAGENEDFGLRHKVLVRKCTAPGRMKALRCFDHVHEPMKLEGVVEIRMAIFQIESLQRDHQGHVSLDFQVCPCDVLSCFMRR